MPSPDPYAAPQISKGVGLVALSYSLFSIQDAVVKWLVTSYAVTQILFTRSLIIVLIAVLIGGRRDVDALVRSHNKGALTFRAVLVFVAWLAYYSSARYLQLAQMTTIYFAAPIIVVALSALILKEKVDAPRWLAVTGGFCGVVLAANPGGAINLLPACAAFFAACSWALGVVLIRLISRSESTSAQMLVSNGFFAVACALTLYWTWKTPDLFSLALMLGIGVAGGLGQFCLYEGFRRAPASVVAPIEYTGLIWAFTYGYLIWSDIPPATVFAGAACIMGSSLALVWFERRRAQRLAQAIGEGVV